MEQQRKKRGENWSSEEKEILRHLIAKSANIIEDKCTKTSVNLLKVREWKNITSKFNKLTGKNRSVEELKLSWKRMKLSAKSNLSFNKTEHNKIGDGSKASSEDLNIMTIHDFTIEVDEYDDDTVIPASTATKDMLIDSKPGPSHEFVTVNEENVEDEVLEDKSINSIEDRKMATKTNKMVDISLVKKRKRSFDYSSEEIHQSILQNSIELKKRQLEIIEEEHQYDIKIANLKMKKFELEMELEHKHNIKQANLKMRKLEYEIALLENELNVSECD